MSQLVATYVYRDASGKPLRRKLRYEPKSFAWQTYDPSGDTWTWRSSDPTSTLYHLDLIADRRPATVYITEGEKDADRLIAQKVIAVTSGNAGSWAAHHSRQLEDHGCTLAIVLPHNDAAGELHALQVARENLKLYTPITTKIVHLPGLEAHGDVADYLECGGSMWGIKALAADTAPIIKDELPPEVTTERRSMIDHGSRSGLVWAFIRPLNLSPMATGKIKVMCPFHPDVRASLSIDLDRLVWYCFACRIGGGPKMFYKKWYEQRFKRPMKPWELRAAMFNLKNRKGTKPVE